MSSAPLSDVTALTETIKQRIVLDRPGRLEISGSQMAGRGGPFVKTINSAAILSGSQDKSPVRE